MSLLARIVLLSLLGSACQGRPASEAAAEPEVVTIPVARTHPPPRVAPVVDLHTDTPTQLLKRGVPLDAPTGLEAGLAALERGGVNTVVYVLWPPRNVKPDPYIFDLEARLRAELARLPRYQLVLDPLGWRAALDADRLAVLLSLEGAHGLEPGGLDTLDRLYALGLRMVGLTWSMSNRYAGSSGDGGGGLSEEGRALVRRANDLGLIVDVSHASDAAALETCRLSRAPVIASHSNADGVRPHARNLPDEIIRCIGEKGGVIGVNLYTDFLAADGADSGDVIRHMLYLARVGGDGVVALGTDFDGYIRTPRDVPTEGELREVWDRLPMHGVAPETVQAWKGGNFARTWEAVWKARAGGG